jgi:stearoyl-CoA desaturase (delta-9 desaturase)
VLALVLAPPAGVVVAAALAWGRGLGWPELAAFAAMYVVGAVGIGAGYHRLFAHRSYRARPAVRLGLAICGAMAGQGPIVYWVALHRRHHERSDEPGDPHSPYVDAAPTAAAGEATGGAAAGAVRAGWRARLRGLVHAHVGWLFTHDVPSTGRTRCGCWPGWRCRPSPRRCGAAACGDCRAGSCGAGWCGSSCNST